MVETEKAQCVPISLYPNQINAVKRYAQYKDSYDSEAIQHIIDDFFNKDDNTTKHNVILYLAVPILFCILTTIINIATDKVFNILLEAGFYFHELYILSRVFMVLSFGSIGVFLACFFLFYKKIKENRGRIVYGD